MTKCAGCRVRHLNCDTYSTCAECEKGGRECVRLNVRFRHLVCPSERITRADYSKYEFFFDGEQTWIDTKGNLEFVGGSNSSVNASPTEEPENTVFGAAGLEAKPRLALMEQPSSTCMPGPTSNSSEVQASVLDNDTPNYLAALDQMSHDPPDNVFVNNISRVHVHSIREISHPGEKLPFDTSLSYSGRELPIPELAWPLKSLQEGMLFQHFVTHLAPWFDVGDSKRHFGKIATRMAITSPLLMTVILAIAALHHSRISGQSDLYNAMTLHDRCLNMIVPMLSDSDRANDDSVLITTTILHLYDGLESGNDLPRHLKGTSIFFPAEAVYDSSQLRRAVFWLHLRQEIYNAYLYQRSVSTNLSNCNFDSKDSSGNDDMWFHQTLYITALVSKWAFGEAASQARWYELCKMVDVWESSRPTNFDPIFFRAQDPENGRYFPEVCYVTDEHVAAAHFFYMAKLLLTTHDPHVPRIGPHMKSAAIAMQKTALSYVRTLVGIAVCNNFIPARFTASLAIIICDNWFTDRREQEALLDFMRDTSRCSGWTRQDAQQGLAKEWGWKEE
ncbi:MAG: hypothetical protein ASARMPRED_004128 [Alectoria sarmentosa]|nr:MAG: hypothetical protein ASARMPRED_004128 [Alectoria sarmentosa]